jgi:catechol 2,3-dioxygenase-like lactoylglutathione lyase family enzyme
MIRGLHGLFYSSDADATRAFMRDALKLPFIDVGGGWLVFDLPQADVGVHPIGENGKPPANTHDVSFYCDDIQGTVADLRSRGVELRHDPQDHGYGFVTYFKMPGGIEVQLYEPKYPKPTANKGGQGGQASAKKAPTGKAAKAPAMKAAAKASPKKGGKAPVAKAGKKAAPARVAKAPAKKPAAKGKATKKKPARR